MGPRLGAILGMKALHFEVEAQGETPVPLTEGPIQVPYFA
jgi:hypothetical protein